MQRDAPPLSAQTDREGACHCPSNGLAWLALFARGFLNRLVVRWSSDAVQGWRAMTRWMFHGQRYAVIGFKASPQRASAHSTQDPRIAMRQAVDEICHDLFVQSSKHHQVQVHPRQIMACLQYIQTVQYLIYPSRPQSPTRHHHHRDLAQGLCSAQLSTARRSLTLSSLHPSCCDIHGCEVAIL